MVLRAEEPLRAPAAPPQPPRLGAAAHAEAFRATSNIARLVKKSGGSGKNNSATEQRINLSPEVPRHPIALRVGRVRSRLFIVCGVENVAQ